MRKLCLAVLIFGMLVILNNAYADVFIWHPAGLGILEHSHYYTWGVEYFSLPSNQSITQAVIKFHSISDLVDDPTDIMYVRFLDSVTAGVSVGNDDGEDGDYFSGQGILLGTYSDTTTPWSAEEDLIFTIPSTNFYQIRNGNFGFGIDPDCFYINDKITFEITTVLSTEPGILSLFGFGLIAVFGYIRVNREKKK